MRLKILLVEDDPDIARVTRRQLERHHQVTVATTLADARTLVDSTRFDAVLADLDLKAENCDELLAYLQRAQPGVRRVLYSGGKQETVQPRLERGLAHGVVPKPATVEQLLAAVKR
jgi:DNA-binding NtrC family response regulator